MPLSTWKLADLTVRDEEALRAVAPYDALKRTLLEDGAIFRVLPSEDEGETPTWERAAFYNHTWWSAENPADVLVEPTIDADVVCHVAWHHATRKALHPGRAPSMEALVLGEAIASAFDLYLVGRLLGAGVPSGFLDTQVPAMTEAAVAAGLPTKAVQSLLASVAAAPAQAFEELRALLFDVTTALTRCADVDAAAQVFAEHADARMAPLLHHFALSTWVSTAWRLGPGARGVDRAAREVDAARRRADDPVAWLVDRWVDRA